MELFIFTLLGVVSRLAPHAPNLTAVGAVSLFMGAKYGVKKSLIVLLSTMLIADSIKGLHSVMWATYGALIVGIFIGKYIASKNSAGWIIGSTVVSSIVFFVVTNFAVWLAPNYMYAKTFSGLMECYAMAIPFFRNTLVGDLMYSGVFFGGFALVESFRKKYATRQVGH
ncbi:MAG: DUF6580 family putative transport protein [Microgenomates group bacterium]